MARGRGPAGRLGEKHAPSDTANRRWQSSTQRSLPLAHLVLEVFVLGFRRTQDGDDRGDRVEHHKTADIGIGPFDAIGAEDLSGDDGDQPAAVNLGDLIPGARPRRAIARRKILGVEGRNGAVAETENETKADDIRESRN
jgi:hypothetical protein